MISTLDPNLFPRRQRVVPGTGDNPLIQSGEGGAPVGARDVPGSADQNAFWNPMIAPYNPPGVEDDRVTLAGGAPELFGLKPPTDKPPASGAASTELFGLKPPAQQQQPAPAPEHWWERMWQGVTGRDVSGAGSLGMGAADPAFGAAQLGVRASLGARMLGEGIPFTPKIPGEPSIEAQQAQVRSADKLIAAREQRYQTGRERAGDTGFDWNRMWGNILSPANIAVGAVPGGAATTRAGQAGVGALRGAVAGAMQPATSGDFGTEKAVQTGSAALLGGIAEPLVSAITGRNPAGVEDFIRNTYRRAVKPTIVGKGTNLQVGGYFDKARAAIDHIVDNKAGLRFQSPDGDIIAGKTPASLEQFGEAIGQTKQKMFKQYHNLTLGAQGAGGAVDLNPIVHNVEQNIINDPVVSLLNPSTVRYAQKKTDAFWAKQDLTPLEAERAIESLNASLKAFYRAASGPVSNPKALQRAAGRAGVDAMIADGLRKQLDQTISALVGPGYQALKNAYGALSAIEKDVVNRAMIAGRQNRGGGIIGNLFDVSSMHDLAMGLLHFDPARVAMAPIKQGAKAMLQHIRSPNRAIKQIFQEAERAKQPTPAVGRVLKAVPKLAVPGAAAGASDEALRYAWPQ